MGFKVLESENSLIFQIITTDTLNIEDVEFCRKELLKKEALYSLVMLDLSVVQTADANALKILAEVGSELLVKNQRFMVIGGDSIISLIRASGYSGCLPCYVGVIPVSKVKAESESSQEIDLDLLFKFALPAVQENLRIYAKKKVTLGDRSVVSDASQVVADIAGIGGFFCNHRRGNIILSFGRDSYLNIVSSIMKEEFVKIEPPVSDWASELVNSVLGKVKSDLRAVGFSCSFGIPAVFSGNELEDFYLKKALNNIQFVRCSGDFGSFFVGLFLAPKDV